METERVLYEFDTNLGHYQVVDMVYMGRRSRVLYSGKRGAAQSGVPLDGNPAMLFDYNQRFLELIDSLKPQNLLIIGGGAFTLPMKIIEFFETVNVDVIEPDKQLLKIAKDFFGLTPNKRLRIIAKDGREYLSGCKKTYDLIILDAFDQDVIPKTLSTKEFLELVANKLSKNGVAASNVISAYHGLQTKIIKQQFATYEAVFRHVAIHPADRVVSYWVSQNFLIIATNRLFKPKYNLRFASLKPPLVSERDIRHD